MIVSRASFLSKGRELCLKNITRLLGHYYLSCHFWCLDSPLEWALRGPRCNGCLQLPGRFYAPQGQNDVYVHKATELVQNDVKRCLHRRNHFSIDCYRGGYCYDVGF